MKDKVMIIIFLIILMLLIVAMFLGIKIGGFNISSLSQLKEKNVELSEKMAVASKLTSVDYPQNIETLESTYDEYNIQKEKYEQMSGFTNGDKKKIYEKKQYDIGYLWKIIGKYAGTYNIGIGMQVQNSSTEGLYDLHFNVKGQYVNISQFIANIENNSDLYFRIYNFKMNGNSEVVNASFVVKDINIDPSTITSTNVGQE